MAGIDVEPAAGRYRATEICERARAHGVILRPLGDVVVWMPPLTLQLNELELLATATTTAIQETPA